MLSSLTIALYCHNFQRRLCWMLSSLLDQKDPPRLVVDVTHMHGNGDPSTEDVVAHYRGRGLDVRSRPWLVTGIEWGTRTCTESGTT